MTSTSPLFTISTRTPRRPVATGAAGKERNFVHRESRLIATTIRATSERLFAMKPPASYILSRRLTTSTDLTAWMSFTIRRPTPRFIVLLRGERFRVLLTLGRASFFHFHQPHPLHSQTDPSNRENCSRTRLPCQSQKICRVEEEEGAAMLSSSSSSIYLEKCSECSGQIIDAGDEFVCQSCGMVTAKEVLEGRERKMPQALDYTPHALGGFLGPPEQEYEEQSPPPPPAFPDASSSFKYLKMVSDFVGKGESCVYSCAKMIERVCEKLSTPKIVVSQSMVIANKVFELRKRNEITVAAISAYSIITACKIEGITSVGVKEVVEAHRALGRRVKATALIQISLDSPIKTRARRAEDYLTRVIAHLSSNSGLRRKLGEHMMSETVYYNKLYKVAREALGIVEREAMGGHSPCGLAASAVYAAEVALAQSDSRIRFLSQREVAECIGVAEYTVREQYGEVFRPVGRELKDAIRREESLPQRLAT